jgi:hypothetical protein
MLPDHVDIILLSATVLNAKDSLLPHAHHHGQHWAARHYSQLLYSQLKVLVTRVASDDEDDITQA